MDNTFKSYKEARRFPLIYLNDFYLIIFKNEKNTN
jgi:hypothetical protein